MDWGLGACPQERPQAGSIVILACQRQRSPSAPLNLRAASGRGRQLVVRALKHRRGVRLLQREVTALMADAQREAAGDAATASRQLRALEGEIGRLVDAVAAVGISPALQQRLRAAETERERLALLIEQAQTAPRQVIDGITARYRRKILELQRVLEEDADRDRTRALLADMLGPVLIGRDADTGETWAEIEKPAERLLLLGGSPGLVAGAGFEPTTFGL
jgi:site-specific DNA recombinase